MNPENIFTVIIIGILIAIIMVIWIYDGVQNRKSNRDWKIKCIESELEHKVSKVTYEARIESLEKQLEHMANRITYILEKNEIDVGEMELEILATKSKYF